MRKETIETLNNLVRNYYFPNRSKLIRYCIDIALPIVVQDCEKIKEHTKTIKELPNIFEFLKKHGFVIYHSNQPKIKVPLGNIHFNSNNERELVKASK